MTAADITIVTRRALFRQAVAHLLAPWTAGTRRVAEGAGAGLAPPPGDLPELTADEVDRVADGALSAAGALAEEDQA